MRQRNALSGVIALSLILGASSIGLAQTNVGLIDMGLVFEGHPVFKDRLQQLKQEADSLQGTVLQQRQMLAKDGESLTLLYAPGSTEFKQKEKELALKAAQLEIDAKDKMRDLMTTEARLHFEVYTDVNRVVEEYCQQFGIRLVLRFNSNKAKADNPESIMQQVNSAVVFYRPDNDITAAVIQRVVQSQARGATNDGPTVRK
jgi:Skp family chaperone for outer membrane proteins